MVAHLFLLCALCCTASLVSAVEERLDEEVGARLDELARGLQELSDSCCTEPEDGFEFMLERLINLELETGNLTNDVRDLGVHYEQQARLTQELEEKQERLETAVAQKFIQSTIAMTVQLSKEVILSDVHQRLVFDTIVTNEGNVYDPETGIFRAPLNGTYIFFLKACATNNDTLSLDIVKDQQTSLSELRCGAKDYKDCNHEVTTSYLSAGSTVGVERANNPNDQNKKKSVHFCSFTGHKID